ncbi:MAG: DUF1343 domain-containing protein [Bacteroidales bacterium]|nr:DUF1343 domain-containing protein [Bacteroidales bacterium]
MFKLLRILLFGLVMASCGHSVASQPESSTTEPFVKDSIVLSNALFERYVPFLESKRVALVVNKASVVGQHHLCDTLVAQGVDVVSIFAPEHGFRSDADAGAKVDDSVDARTGIPIVSLYGKNKKPTAAQMADVDVVIYDLQDVGVRFYTYISTLHYVMEACAENGKTLIVLDRPNPNGDYIDGPVLEPDCRSFVGLDCIPIVYGMTAGELACMINGERWLGGGATCDLKVVTMPAYSHSMRYDIGIAPSPNLRTPHAIRLYPSLCFFEATNVSVGRGTDFPFEVIGAPDGRFDDFNFTPQPSAGAASPLHNGLDCSGFDLRNVDAPKSVSLSWFLDFRSKMGDKFWLNPKFFDLLAGTKKLRQQIDAGLSEDSIRATWQPKLEAFKALRNKYLLYDVAEKQPGTIEWESAIHSAYVDSVYARMTLDERIAQLIWVTVEGSLTGPVSEEAIGRAVQIVSEHQIGGVLIQQTNVGQIPRIVNSLSAVARYPLMFAADAENGLSMKFRNATVFPRNMSLGAIRNSDELLFEMGQMVSQQMRACGLNVNFAPVVDVNTNPLNPIIGIRSFGEDPARVMKCGASFVRGVQSAGCLAVAKHFPGHGDTDKDSHLALPAVMHDRARLDSVELKPFRHLIDNGVMGVMSAHLIVPALDSSNRSSSMSSSMMNDILRKELNFNGLIISDAMNMQGAIVAAKGDSPECLSLVAGNDIVEFSTNVMRAIKAVHDALEADSSLVSDFEMKVRRTLAAKQWSGVEHRPFGHAEAKVNSIEAWLLSRRLYDASLTVIDSLNMQMPIGKVELCGKWNGTAIRNSDNGSSVWIFADDTSLSEARAKLDGYAGRMPVVFVYAGNPYRLKNINWHDYKCGLILAYENNLQAREALLRFAVQGGHADGILPVSVSRFAQGTSFIIDRICR